LDENIDCGYTYLSCDTERSTFVESPRVLELYDELIECMGVVGINKIQQKDIFIVIATILRLGNITFTEDEQERVNIGNSSELERVCALGGLPYVDVMRSFSTRQFGVRSIITCHLTLEQVRC
jgi:myosin heavy subunit